VPARLNHTIVWVRDREESARFLVELLDLPEPTEYGPFLVVQVDNDVSLDYAVTEDGEIHPQHYAFLVTEPEFDAVFGRIRERGLTHWADPGRRRAGEVNTNDGGRGVYWEDPSGHFLEIITRPYGSGG
jgi:catechol 2,3-dioxygenase-like lactoylglutathione lyase family enzyme